MIKKCESKWNEVNAGKLKIKNIKLNKKSLITLPGPGRRARVYVRVCVGACKCAYMSNIHLNKAKSANILTILKYFKIIVTNNLTKHLTCDIITMNNKI